MNSFKNIIGYEDIKKKLVVISECLKNPAKYTSQGATFSSGLLLHGPIGIGKTKLSEEFIKESGCHYITIRKSKANGAFIDYLDKCFIEAKEYAKDTNSTCVVFCDDLCKWASGDDDILRNSEEFTALQACIDSCKGYQVFILATANRLDVIPQSLLRAGRFDTVIGMTSPKYSDSVEIIRYYLKNIQNLADDIDVEQLAKILVGRSCATLANVINKATIQRTFEGRTKITMDDLVKASLEELYGATLIDDIDYPYLRDTAVHEIGHCLISWIRQSYSVALVAIKENSGEVKGITIPFQDEYYFEDIKYSKNRVMSLLGGMAATDVILGKTDTGAENDCERAQRIVERLLSQYKEQKFTFISSLEYEMSESQLSRYETAIASELNNYYEQAKDIIKANRETFDKLVEELCEKKVLLPKDIAKHFS